MAFEKQPVLWAVFGLQALCTLFFVVETGSDLLGYEDAVSFGNTDAFEVFVTIILAIGVIFTGLQIRRVMQRQRRLAEQIDVARGALGEVIESHFDIWGLTESERDVAFLAIKGFSVADMARLRETKEGTVKAQCTAVYRKAGVTGRLQLLSLFIEELMADSLVAQP